jgi:hypothetical protein
MLNEYVSCWRGISPFFNSIYGLDLPIIFHRLFDVPFDWKCITYYWKLWSAGVSQRINTTCTIYTAPTHYQFYHYSCYSLQPFSHVLSTSLWQPLQSTLLKSHERTSLWQPLQSTIVYSTPVLWTYKFVTAAAVYSTQVPWTYKFVTAATVYYSLFYSRPMNVQVCDSRYSLLYSNVPCTDSICNCKYCF